MDRYMEVVFLDKDGNAFQTGVGAEMKDDRATTKAFESIKESAVKIEDADFIIDLHEKGGTIVDSIGISVDTFEQVTGQKFQGAQYYRNYDKAYWEKLEREQRGACSHFKTLDHRSLVAGKAICGTVSMFGFHKFKRAGFDPVAGIVDIGRTIREWQRNQVIL